MKFFWRLVASCLAIYLLGNCFPDSAGYHSVIWLLAAGIVVSLLYTFVRPALQLMGSPISLLTGGLFVLVINAGLVKLAAVIVNGFWLQGFWLCIGAALLIGVFDLVFCRLSKAVKLCLK